MDFHNNFIKSKLWPQDYSLTSSQAVEIEYLREKEAHDKTKGKLKKAIKLIEELIKQNYRQSSPSPPNIKHMFHEGNSSGSPPSNGYESARCHH